MINQAVICLKICKKGEKFMDNIEMMVGYAYVPPQKNFNTYTPEEALENGTLFPELDLDMCEYLWGVKEDKCDD